MQDVPKLAHLDTTTLFPYAINDNGFKAKEDCSNPLPKNTTI